jgi:hypothetical protein
MKQGQDKKNQQIPIKKTPSGGANHKKTTHQKKTRKIKILVL